MDILSILGTVAGLISLAESLVPPLLDFGEHMQSYGKKLSELKDEIHSLSGLLFVLQVVLQRIGVGGTPHPPIGESIFLS